MNYIQETIKIVELVLVSQVVNMVNILKIKLNTRFQGLLTAE